MPDYVLALSQLTGEQPGPSRVQSSLHRSYLVKDWLTRLACLHHADDCVEMSSG